MVKEAFEGYKKPSVAIDTVILRTCDYGEVSNRQVPIKRLQVLLVKKSSEDKWSLPGTIIRLGETSKAAISRLFGDESKINDITFEQLYTVDNNVNRDERGHVISIVYIGMYNGLKDNIIDSYDEMQWFWVTSDRKFVDKDTGEVVKTLKYDHVSIISDTIARLKGKLLYTDVGFNFVGERFTLRELENTFVAINERPIPGFRRIIASKVEATELMSTGYAYRPAGLYKKKIGKDKIKIGNSNE